MDTAGTKATAVYEAKAKSWDRWTTVVIVALLLVPLPFVRFENWPKREVISEHIIMPWSRFNICYTSFPDGSAVEEAYGFTWKGSLTPMCLGSPALIVVNSLYPPVFQWQSSPERTLTNLYGEGGLLRVDTFWQPVLFWPLKMVWGIFRNP